jgi:HSP20 family protein
MTLYNETFVQDFVDVLYKEFDANPFKSLFDTKPVYPFDVYYDEAGSAVFEVPVVGADKKDVKIVIENNVLKITRKTEDLPNYSSRKYAVKKIVNKDCNLTFSFPNKGYDYSKIEATFDKGLLKVIVPKSKEKDSGTIKVDIK